MKIFLITWKFSPNFHIFFFKFWDNFVQLVSLSISGMIFTLIFCMIFSFLLAHFVPNPQIYFALIAGITIFAFLFKLKANHRSLYVTFNPSLYLVSFLLAWKRHGENMCLGALIFKSGYNRLTSVFSSNNCFKNIRYQCRISFYWNRNTED